MEAHDTGDRPAEAIAQSLKTNSITNSAELQKDTEKRVVKLTAKALAEKLERLQSERKSKLNRASKL